MYNCSRAHRVLLLVPSRYHVLFWYYISGPALLSFFLYLNIRFSVGCRPQSQVTSIPLAHIVFDVFLVNRIGEARYYKTFLCANQSVS